MKLSCHRVKNLSYILIDNFFNGEELKEVVQETKDLRRFSLPASKTRTAIENNKPMKTGKGVFLDGLYEKNRKASAILNYSRKIFSSELTQYAEQFDVVFGFIQESNFDSTLLNYYESEQEYKPHKDVALISSVIFLQEGDFTGGDFTFLDQDHVIKMIHNRAVIFPSCAKHGALPIQGSGTRISIAQFIDYKDNGC